MYIILHILKFKILTFVDLHRAFNLKSTLKNLGVVIVYIIFAFGIFIFSKNIIIYLMDEVGIGLYLLHRFIFVVLFIFFIAVNVGNVVVSYSTLFKSNEVSFLLTKPVSYRNIFLIKFLDNFFYSSSTLLLIIFAVVSSYSIYFNLPWYFVPLAMLFIILPLMFIAGVLGAIVLLILLRFAAGFGIKKVLTLLALIYAGAIISFYFISSPVSLVAKIFQYFPNINLYFGFLESPVIKLLPNHWVAEALYWITTGKLFAAGWYIYLLITISILLYLFSLILAKKWFYKTWTVFTNLRSELSVKKKKIRKAVFTFGKNSSLEPRREVLLKRDLILFLRAPSQWMHFVVMIFLITIFIVSTSNIDTMILNTYDIYLKSIFYLIIFLFNVFLIASLSLRFIFPLVSLEGETIWKIKTAPLNYKKLMLTRLFTYFTVIFVIGQVLNFFSTNQISASLVAVSQINIAFITITLVSLNFGMGSAFANYKEKNPIRVASSQGASLTFLFMIVYMVFLVLILFPAISNFFFNLRKGGFPPVSELLFPSIILGSLTLIFAYLSISKGIQHFAKDI